MCLTHPEAERNPMILSLFRKNTATDAVYGVYRAIVAQSRQPVFYAEWGVPDTVTGRFDMISLHMAMVFRRLRANDAAKDFSQAVFDLFFKDMDRSLREMGAGDLGVPKKIQKMGNLFFGLLAAINEAMDRGDKEALASVFSRNIFGDAGMDHARTLADYALELDKTLLAQPVEAITGGTVTFGTTP